MSESADGITALLEILGQAGEAGAARESARRLEGQSPQRERP